MAASVACAVPARMASGRFPGKMLAIIEGLPLIVRTLTRAREAGCFSQVLCLTDSQQIVDTVQAHGFEAALTGDAQNGTERIALNLHRIESHLVVNLQGDEPVFPLEPLRLICRALWENPDCMHTLVHADEPSEERRSNPNRVKALVDREGFVKDFRRLMPAYDPAIYVIKPHMGVYGYSSEFLKAYAKTPASVREKEESLETLRLWPFQGRYLFMAHEARQESQAVDVPSDIDLVRLFLKKHNNGERRTPDNKVS